MFERFLLTLLLITISMTLFFVVRRMHARRLDRLASPARAGSTQPALVYFRSDSCGPCLAQGHYLQPLEKQFDGRLAIQKIDADVEPEIASHYGVFTLPTTLVMDGNGEVKYINYGLTTTSKLAEQVKKVL
jgi:thioredoxin-like negative regulator of GroEL